MSHTVEERQLLVTMEPVIRMFTSDTGTVRWITTMTGAEGLEFSVSGPEDWRNSSFFTDPMSLLRFQTEYERFLRASGYEVSLVDQPSLARRAERTAARKRGPSSTHVGPPSGGPLRLFRLNMNPALELLAVPAA